MSGSEIAKVAIPVGLSAATGGMALPAATGLSGVLGASVPTWLTGMGIGALTGAAGSALTGQNPMRGALLGGATGGIMNSGAFDGIGGLASGASDVPANAANAYNTASINAAGPMMPNTMMASPASSGIGGMMDAFANRPSWAIPLAVGASALVEPDTSVTPISKKDKEPSPLAKPLEREYTSVSPSDYYTDSGNRKYFNQINPSVQYYAHGGAVKPQFKRDVAGGGIGALVRGAGDGTSDDIPAMLSDGEYVIPAAVVSALGNGSNDAGAKKLDKMKKQVLQKHYKGGSVKKSSGIGAYMGAA